MAKTPTAIRSLARTHTEAAIATLAGIMHQPTSSPMARIAAAKALLDRGWGRPTVTLAGDRDNPLPILEIVRTIVDPKHDEVETETVIACPAAVAGRLS